MYPKSTLDVCKTFVFEAAHRLPFHDGKCHDLHGHSYKVTICFRGPVQTRTTGMNPETGMVIDFGKIKEAWKEIEEKYLDHHYLNEFITNPTAENLCLWLLNHFIDKFDIPVCEIKVHETETSYVHWTMENGWH